MEGPALGFGNEGAAAPREARKGKNLLSLGRGLTVRLNLYHFGRTQAAGMCAGTIFDLKCCMVDAEMLL